MSEVQKKQKYILRYYLPVKPIYDEEYTQKRFKQLLEYCEENGVDAVMFYVALNPNFYYMPDSPEYTEEVRNQMLPYIQKLREKGIGYQINFQDLLGQTLHGVDFTDEYDWEYLVDQRGRTSKGCACPLGKKFRLNSEKRLKIWAETNPDVIWMDDDFRMHNHGTPGFAVFEGESGYTDYYCFCDEHIRRFNQKVGGNYTREMIINGISQTGEPTLLRTQYLSFLSETMVETAQWVEKSVHAVSPATKIAQMTSYPDVHAAEGRDWREFLTALSGEYAPIIRPTFGWYQEGLSRNFIDCYRVLAQMITQIKASYGEGVNYAPELENTRYTVWSKSRKVTEAQLLLSAFIGCEDITLALHDLDGGALFDEPAYAKMLKEIKPRLHELVSLDLLNAEPLGVAIPTSPKSGFNYRLKRGEIYDNLGGTTRYVEGYLLKMGVPCYYATPEDCAKAEMVALDGFTAGFLTDAEIMTLLQKNVFLEGAAVECLCERGFAEYIGVKNFKKLPITIQSEVFYTFKRQDDTFIRVPSRVGGNRWLVMDLSDGVERLSDFVSPRGEKYPACTYFENKIGGKVLAYGAIDDWGNGFFTHHRVRFIKDAMAKVAPKIPYVACNGATLTVSRRNNKNEIYHFIMNLASDKANDLFVNGKKLDCDLGLYEATVYKENF